MLLGTGTGLFVSHLSPVLLSAAPHSHLARVQSLLSVAQSTALLIMNSALGGIARTATADTTILVCAGVLATAAALAYCSPAIRGINTTP